MMAAAAVLTVSSCASQKQLPENGIALQFMDTSVRPQDDFFHLRCKRKLGKNSRNSFGQSKLGKF